jgi:hypothetical protein
MVELGRVRGAATIVVWIAVAAAGLAGCAHGVGVGRVPETETVLPWEWWRDLATVAVVPEDDRVLMRSSFCPSGCFEDRHSASDSRFIRVDRRGEGVIFEAEGAGALTRIWMVMGDGVSEPLDPSIRIRIRLDGARKPVVDLPLPELFAGTVPPFLEPLVASRELSGGGNVSYVPIPFRRGCTVSLVGAAEARIWFQVTARLVADASRVRPFTGREDLAPMRAMLASAGTDPWSGGPYPTVSREVTLRPGRGELVAAFEGPDVINGLEAARASLHLRRPRSDAGTAPRPVRYRPEQ